MRYKVSASHLIPGTNVLKNKLDIIDKKELLRAETFYFIARLKTLPKGDLSVEHFKKIHAHLLQDVYEWAGQFRDIPTARGSARFCQPQFISQELKKAIKSFDLDEIRKKQPKAFANKIAEIVGDLNAIHPFLDGNGRIIRVYIKELSDAAGRKLDLEKLKGSLWNKASQKSFHGDNNPMADLLFKNFIKINSEEQ